MAVTRTFTISTDSVPSVTEPKEPSDLGERTASEPTTTEGEDEPQETAGTSQHTSLLTDPSHKGKCDQININVNHVCVNGSNLLAI